MAKSAPRPEGINLGQLQAEFISARKAARASALALERAMIVDGSAKVALEKARERLAQASRAVLS